MPNARVHPVNPYVEFKEEEVEQSIPSRFEKIVRLYGDRPAVKTKEQLLTYEELNSSADRVARAILEKQDRTNEPVAILLGHDASIITAIFGSLKAGKIYVPLDPSFPIARLAYMASNSRAPIVLTDREHLSMAAQLAQNELAIITVDELSPDLPPDDLSHPLPPDTLAWILYTSGSTGDPKGIVHSHRSVLHEVMNYTNMTRIGAEDRLVLVSSCSFADSVRTIFGALLNGATLYPFDVKKEGLAPLADWLIKEEITLYRSVPTLFRYFAKTLTQANLFPKLRLIYFAGEPVYKRDLELCRKFFSPDCIVVNGLGSTESLTFRMYFMDSKTRVEDYNVPVGYPLEGKEVLLLDENRQEVGPDSTGEIAVRSRYLAQGYWDNPRATREKFLPDPAVKNGRIYLTGDLGLMASNGCLIHQGRKDFQVKIRGYRIELAEIEMALLEYEGIKEVAVAAREDSAGNMRLAAYFVASEDRGPNISDLKAFLRKKFPDYMVPAVYMELDALPLTSTGKTNRNALPPPGSARPDLKTPWVAPRNSIEKKLGKIWSEVLSVESVGIHDNFFDLGGHSLAASQVISRIIKTFRLELPLKALFNTPTIAEIALIIEDSQMKKASDEDVARMLSELEALSEPKADDND